MIELQQRDKKTVSYFVAEDEYSCGNESIRKTRSYKEEKVSGALQSNRYGKRSKEYLRTWYLQSKHPRDGIRTTAGELI